MKKLRKLVGVSVLCVIIFMVVALFQYQNGDDLPALLPDQMEYEYNQGWPAVPLDGAKEPGAKPFGNKRTVPGCIGAGGM